ncbi:hypothetical protein [Methanococcoides alaskense]|uniref:Uncharacterized protein n=1 Tax=Methanococcoides alaskense TaxID=325778 RepID=A0AA90ZCQ0_9EURY|nr:hypothetical protein [Methanococcoides alaskense]MDR6222803.1 hypothetical protein [Methanococcoides alaskense]
MGQDPEIINLHMHPASSSITIANENVQRGIFKELPEKCIR